MRKVEGLRRWVGGLGLLFIALDHLTCAEPLYRIEQISSGPRHHRAPAINNNADVIWMEEFTPGGWQIVNREGQRLTSPDGTWTTAMYPGLADDGSFVCFRQRRDGYCPGFLLRYPGASTVEFCSVNRMNGDHRDVVQLCSISSDGKVMWGYEFFGANLARRFFVSNVGQVSNGSYVTWEHPSVNRHGKFVYELAGRILSSEGVALATGVQPSISDEGEVVYASGGKVWSRSPNGEVQEVDVGSDPAVNRRGEIVYERVVNGIYQIFLATPKVRLETLDASDFSTGSEVNPDPAALALGGQRVKAVAADGVSRVLLRVPVVNQTTPVAVTFKIEDPNPDSGDLVPLTAQDSPASTWTLQSELISGKYYAFALYRAPIDFNPARTTVRLIVEYGGKTRSELLTIRRPPVVLIHGTWSDPSTWRDFWPLITPGQSIFALVPRVQSHPHFEVHLLDYTAFNAQPFIGGAFIVAGQIKDVLASARRAGVAVSRVDAVAHSLGGNLARLLTSFPGYRTPINFKHGDLRRLITLATPHHGTFFADAINTINPPRDVVILALLAGRPIRDGVVDDFKTGSPRIRNLPLAAEVEVHAILGITSNAVQFHPAFTALKAVFKMITGSPPDARIETIFHSEPHDWTVQANSARGGLSDVRHYTRFEDVMHFTIESIWAKVGLAALQDSRGLISSSVADRVIDLLKAPTGSGDFANGFPPNALVPVPAAGGVPEPPVFSDYLLISSIDPPQRIAPGDRVRLRVESSDERSIKSVLFLSPDPSSGLSTFIGGQVTEPPFEFVFEVPQESNLGARPFAALAEDSSGVLSLVQRTLSVEPSAPLKSLLVRPDRVVLDSEMKSFQLSVTGYFADESLRGLTRVPGTSYESSDPKVAEVTETGLVHAGGDGSAFLVVRRDGLEFTISVVVKGISLQDAVQLPGDCNQDGQLDISDPICVLGVLFLGSPGRFPCGDGRPNEAGNLGLLDWQPDGQVDISDAIALLSFLFNQGQAHALAVPGQETSKCVPIAGCQDNLACGTDPDRDRDGLPDAVEIAMGLSPNRADSNGDGIFDGNEDSDRDGFVNADELLLGTDPSRKDSDGDGLSDGDEINVYFTSPTNRDADGDGINDGDEVSEQSSPVDPRSVPRVLKVGIAVGKIFTVRNLTDPSKTVGIAIGSAFTVKNLVNGGNVRPPLVPIAIGPAFTVKNLANGQVGGGGQAGQKADGE